MAQRSAFVFATVTFVLFLSGCPLRSLHPLYTEKDLVFDPVLLGTWGEKESKDTWTFEKSGPDSYKLYYVQNGIPATFDVHLLRLQGMTFIDMYPEEPEVQNDLYNIHLIPAHTFSRVWIERNELRLSFLDDRWLKETIEEKKVKIPYQVLESGVVLTAPTDELQQFVLEYADSAKAFPQPSVFFRRPEK